MLAHLLKPACKDSASRNTPPVPRTTTFMRRCFGHHLGFQRSRLSCIVLFVLQGRLCKLLPVFVTAFQASKAMFERFGTGFVSWFPHVHDPDGVSGPQWQWSVMMAVPVLGSATSLMRLAFDCCTVFRFDFYVTDHLDHLLLGSRWSVYASFTSTTRFTGVVCLLRGFPFIAYHSWRVWTCIAGLCSAELMRTSSNWFKPVIAVCLMMAVLLLSSMASLLRLAFDCCTVFRSDFYVTDNLDHLLLGSGWVVHASFGP